MILGLLPAIGGGLQDLQRTGQHSFLIDVYFKRYVRSFDKIYYFSYFEETLGEYTADQEILDKVVLLPRKVNAPRRIYALALPFLYRSRFRQCAVVRVFQTTGALPAVIARGVYGVPYVVTYGYRYAEFARVEGARLKALWLASVEKRFLQAAAGVIVTTQELQRYVENFVNGARIHYIPNGVDTALFRPARHPPSAGGAKKLLFLGRLEEQKNLFRLIEALSFLKDDLTLSLAVIGTGSLGHRLAECAYQKGVAVEFKGTIPHEELPAHFHQAHAFVLPSLIEGHPKALIEAMSCGLPCVVSDCDGNRTLIEEGQTGLLFDPYNVEEMARQIKRVMLDETWAYQLGRRARQYVVDNYDIDPLLRTEIDLLQEVGRERGSFA